MSIGTLEQRVQKLESTVEDVQHLLAQQPVSTTQKRGWRWFVGNYAGSPDFEEVVRIGKELCNADRPAD